MNTTDPLDLLTAARPTDASLEATWSSIRSDATLATTQQLAQTYATAPMISRVPRRRLNRRRFAALVSAVAVIAVAAVVAPALLGDRGSSATAALRPLVVIAENADPVVIPAGHFLRIVTVENPDGMPPGSMGDAPLTHESWTSADGHLWRRDTTPNGKSRLYDLGVQSGDIVNLPGKPLPILDLPTEPDALEALLRRHVSGSSSRNEAVFVAISELSRSGVLPPKVRAASLQVLATLPEVTAAKVSVDGKSLVRVDFADDSIRKDLTFSLLFDPTTATLVEEAETFRGVPGYRSVVTSRQIVDAMPPGLADQAAKEAAERTEWIRNCNGSIPTPAGFDCSLKPDSIESAE